MPDESNRCEEFELAALRAARDALAPAERARLEQHLSGCVACRSFAELSRATEAVLRGSASGALAEPARAVLHTRIREWRSRIARSTVMVVLIVALERWSGGGASAAFAGSMVLLVAAAGIVFHVLPQRRRLLAASAAGGDELVASLRSEIEGELEAHRKLGPLRAVYWALVVLAAGYALLRAGGEARFDTRSLALLALAAVLASRLWHDARRRIPELRRQREDLA